MSLYHEAADILTAPANNGGSLKSRIFNHASLKSPRAQVYALAIESCKWSSILKEVIERAGLLSLERKLTPALSILLVHDLLLAKKGIALPATHGLRAGVERHKARLQAEFTKARIKRNLGSIEALKQHVNSGLENGPDAEVPHPRWIRINTLKTQLEDLLETTFADYERVGTVDAVRQPGTPRLYIDEHVPNLVAVPASIDLTKSEAYTSGAIVFQDKASCFPAYMLDPLPEDGDIIDTCAAPGNKTTHLAAINSAHMSELDDAAQTIHAFEKSKPRAETLEKMVARAGCLDFVRVHAGQDFLKVDPLAPEFKNVGALLLDPSCSGSGIVGRDDMPVLRLPSATSSTTTTTTTTQKASLKRKRPAKADPPSTSSSTSMVMNNTTDMENEDEDENPITTSGQDLATRLVSLSQFQLSLLLHAFAFPHARKVTYSTCSVYVQENEDVVLRALESSVARERGWRVLRREEQVRGLREWAVRGVLGEDEGGATGDEGKRRREEVADASVRADKGGGEGTMGFFVVGFVRDGEVGKGGGIEGEGFLRDERGFIVRDLLGFPVRAVGAGVDDGKEVEQVQPQQQEEEEWNGFGDDADEDHINLTPTGPVQGPDIEISGADAGKEVTAGEENGTSTTTKKRKKKRKGGK